MQYRAAQQISEPRRVPVRPILSGPTAPAVPGVLHVISGHFQAGAERHVLLLARAQRDHGMRVAVAYRRGGWLGEELARYGLPVMPMAMRGTVDFMAVLTLRRIARREGMSVIHGYLARGMSYAGAAARSHGLCSVGTDHLSNPNRAMPRLDAVIAVSEDGRRRAVAAGAREERVRRVLNGVDGDALRRDVKHADALRERAGVPACEPVAGILGRLTPVKGPDTLLRAAALFRGACPWLLFAGPEEPEWRARLDAVAREAGVAGRLRDLGPLSEVGAFLAACDVVVAPSRMEACPMAVMEAMSAGRPVVASAVGGIPEIIEDGETGILVPADDPPALAFALEELMMDPMRQARMGRAAAGAASHFTVEAMRLATMQVYAAAMDAARERRRG